MQRMWDRSQPVPVRDILEDLQQTRDIAYTTVMTVMDNLHGKGLLERRREGRAYLYWPASSREDYHAELMADVLAESSDPNATLLRFVEKIGPREANRMRRALHQTPRRKPRP
jgi:predicted transcriptional regulator